MIYRNQVVDIRYYVLRHCIVLNNLYEFETKIIIKKKIIFREDFLSNFHWWIFRINYVKQKDLVKIFKFTKNLIEKCESFNKIIWDWKIICFFPVFLKKIRNLVKQQVQRTCIVQSS